MSHNVRVINFWNETDNCFAPRVRDIPAREDIKKFMQEFLFNLIPVILIKDSMQPIITRGFLGTNISKSCFNFRNVRRGNEILDMINIEFNKLLGVVIIRRNGINLFHRKCSLGKFLFHY